MSIQTAVGFGSANRWMSLPHPAAPPVNSKANHPVSIKPDSPPRSSSGASSCAHQTVQIGVPSFVRLRMCPKPLIDTCDLCSAGILASTPVFFRQPRSARANFLLITWYGTGSLAASKMYSNNDLFRTELCGCWEGATRQFTIARAGCSLTSRQKTGMQVAIWHLLLPIPGCSLQAGRKPECKLQPGNLLLPIPGCTLQAGRDREVSS
eukprot:scaffold7303_cov153-Amphora_coffeaeformis.AAC.6